MSPSRTPAQIVQYSEFGGVDVLELVDVERPDAGPGEVVVEVLSAGVNHIEAYIRQGLFKDELPTRFPQSQGTDFAGLVVQAGDGVTGFKRGAEVIGHAVMSSHANYVVVPQENLVPKPKRLGWEVAGGLFLAGITAIRALRAVHVLPGDTIVISAAAGGVGSMEAQLAKLAGATVIGTCGERNFDYLRQIGIKPVVYGDGLVDRIRELAPGGVSAYIDNFGDYNAEAAGELGVSVSRFSSSESRKALEVSAFRNSSAADASLTTDLAYIAELAAERKVDVLVSGFYPFSRIQDAFDDLEKRHARGKIVLGMRAVDNSFQGTNFIRARDVHDQRA